MPRDTRRSVEITFSEDQAEWLTAEADRLGCTRGDVIKRAVDAMRGDDDPEAAGAPVRTSSDSATIDTILATLELFIPRYIADHPKPMLTDDERQVVNQRWATFKKNRAAELEERR